MVQLQWRGMIVVLRVKRASERCPAVLVVVGRFLFREGLSLISRFKLIPSNWKQGAACCVRLYNTHTESTGPRGRTQQDTASSLVVVFARAARQSPTARGRQQDALARSLRLAFRVRATRPLSN